MFNEIHGASNPSLNTKANQKTMTPPQAAPGQMVRPRGSLDVALDTIGEEIGALQGAIGALREQMGTVLRPSVQAPTNEVAAGSCGDSIPAVCPAAGYAQNLRRRLNGLLGEVRDLMDRLDA